MDEEQNQQQQDMVNKVSTDVNETKNMVKDSASLAKNVGTGNIVGAAKDSFNLLKNKKARRTLIILLTIPIIIVVAIASFLYSIFDTIGNTIQGVLDGITDLFVVDNEGAISISDEQVDKIIDSLLDLGINLDDLKLMGDVDYTDPDIETKYREALRKYIRKFFEAQVVTQTLYTNPNWFTEEILNSGKTYGTVFVYRTDGEDTIEPGQGEPLTYKPYEEMEQLVQARNIEEIRKYFSVQGEKLIIPEWTTTTVNGEENVQITLRSMDYKNAISQYTTSMNFFLYLTMVTQNPEFVAAFTDLVKNSEIRLTVIDTTSTTTEIETYTYTEHTKGSNITLTPEGEQVLPVNTSRDRSERTLTVTETTTPTLKVTYVKTWFCEQSIIYQKKTTGPNESSNTQDGTTNEELRDEREPADPPDGDTVSWITDQQITTTTTITGTTYQESVRGDVIDKTGEKGSQGILDTNGNGLVDENEKVDENTTFLGLLDNKFKIPNSSKYEAAGKTSLVRTADWFFQLLQKDASLQNLEQIMRYVLYKYTGKDYGVTTFPSGIYQISDFTSAGGTLKALIRYWENGNSTPESSPDGTKYKVFDDGYGNPTVGYGITIQWQYDRLVKHGYTGYTKEEIIQRYQQEDIYIDKEIVDAVEDEIISEKKALVQGLGLNLTTYQEYALVLRSYNWTLEGFVEAYNQYWNPETDNERYFGQEVDYTHKLYIEYMSQTTYANGEYSPGLKRRRDAEWALFSAGYYTHTNTYWSDSAESVVNFALQLVGQNHTLFTSYTTSEGKTFWGADWCAMFVSYCFDQQGLIPDVLNESYVGCTDEVANLKARGEFENSSALGGSYTPQPGDIIFFTKDGGVTSYHTGIVVKCDGAKVYTVEGNSGYGSGATSWSNSRVTENSYSINSNNIYGYFPASAK